MPLSQLSTPLTRDQAYALVDAVMERDDLALTASAHEDAETGEWVFEATCEMLPDLLAFEDLARTILGGGVDFTIAPVDTDTNWVAKSLEGLKPVIAGGVYVYGSHDDATVWSMVAFLRKLPGMTPAQYRAIVARAPPDDDMDAGGGRPAAGRQGMPGMAGGLPLSRSR